MRKDEGWCLHSLDDQTHYTDISSSCQALYIYQNCVKATLSLQSAKGKTEPKLKRNLFCSNSLLPGRCSQMLLHASRAWIHSGDHDGDKILHREQA